MAFSPVPSDSKKQINKAGRALVKDNSLEWALSSADKWRACHAYPINTFQATLRRKLSKFGHDSIVAQRLKRMPTIIDKLRRYPTMQLTTMQDIGGVRAILGSVDEVNRLSAEYRDKSRFIHELYNEKDYIQNPRSEDGYRSIHLIYKYKNRRAPQYDGLLLELQIRTKLQHVWATAVETMGTFLGQALKSRQGDQDWLDFFAITSSAFAYEENSKLVPRYMHMSKKETNLAVAGSERKIKALDKMKGFSTAANEIVKNRNKGNPWHYHLIILNSLEKTVQIKPYTRDNVKKAVADYAEAEAEATKGRRIEPVLVSAGPIETLRRAYPNFFLDISDFVKHVNSIVVSANS